MELFWTSVVNGTLWSSRYCSMLYESVNPIEKLLVAGGCQRALDHQVLRLDDQRRAQSGPVLPQRPSESR